MKLEELNVSHAVYQIFRRNGIDTMEQLQALKDYQIMKLRGVGVKKFDEIKNALKEVENGN